MSQTASRAKTTVTPAASRETRSLLQRKCACGGSPGVDGECAACRKSRLQRQPDRQSEPTGVPAIVHDVLRSSGQPLDPATRAFMEPRFGHDFSRVRVHAGGQAAESARAVNALAYTVGNDVVFETGRYAPQSAQGQRLLAHELAHVVQQGGRAVRSSSRLGSRPMITPPSARRKQPRTPSPTTGRRMSGKPRVTRRARCCCIGTKMIWLPTRAARVATVYVDPGRQGVIYHGQRRVGTSGTWGERAERRADPRWPVHHPSRHHASQPLPSRNPACVG